MLLGEMVVTEMTRGAVVRVTGYCAPSLFSGYLNLVADEVKTARFTFFPMNRTALYLFI